MAGGVSEHTEMMLAVARRRGFRRGLLLLASVCVLLATAWALVIPGSTLANATFCGQEEHEHSDACYQLVLSCGFDAVSVEGSLGEDAAASSESGFASSDVNAVDAADAVAAGESSGADAAAAAEGSSDSGTASGVDAGSADAAAAVDSAGAVEADATVISADAAIVGSASEALAAEPSDEASSSSSSAGHVHSEACYKRVLACDVSEHEHSLACYSDSLADLETEATWEATLPASDDMTGVWAADVLAVAKSQLGYAESSANYVVGENATGVEIAKGYTRYGAWWGDAYGDWCAMFASFCLHYAGVSEEVVPQNANCQSWIEALSAEGVGLWRPVEAVEDADGVAVRTGVAVVPAKVAALWEDETSEAANEAAESGDGAASAAGLSDESEAQYTALGSLVYEPQPGDLVFFDWDGDDVADHVGFVYELLDAEGKLVVGADAEASLDGGASAAVESAAEASSDGVSSDGVAGGEDADDAEAADASASSESSAVKLRTIEGNVSDGSSDAVCYREYDLADSSILGYAALPENPEAQVAMLDADEPVVLSSDTIVSDPPTVAESASTSEFIDLNLYDYNGYINANYNKNNNYPGFQWNGGAYVESSYNRHIVDCIDFGNSNITDFSYDSSSSGTNGKSSNAQLIGKLYTYESAKNTGALNWLWWDGSSASTTNRPVGMSTMGSSALSLTLGSDGYPALSDGTSLAYLFTNGTAVTKKNTQSVDGLFQKDENTGAYYYNSRENHAQYSDNTFMLYDQIITPNFIVYPFGNFLPFNTITDSGKATQVSGIDGSSGATVSDYIEQLQEDMKSSLTGSQTKTQLDAMLEKYQASITSDDITTAKQAITDYLIGSGATSADLISDEQLNRLYNIDWDEETNFFFGMDMTMDFMQPKGGMTGNDTNGDGKSDYPMEFYFTGDDDVWVYIDGVLFLDLSGIHRHVGGKIDFVNGVVGYYELDTAGAGDVSSTPYQTYTFEELLTASGKFTEEEVAGMLVEVGQDEEGKTLKTFKDYSTHQFKFYYMERGSGSSVCRMNFNFPLLKQNSISVSKEVDSGDTEVLGDPDYQFQVLKANADGDKTNEPFIGVNASYTLYDADGKEVDTGTTDANGVFTLKAGQRAEFSGIDENAGKYYVRELFDSSTFAQYETVTVSGESTKTSNNVTETFTGVDSPVKDMSDGTTVFRFTNKVDTSKLASLSIKKELEGSSQTGEAEFKIEVKLDGALLPKGTEYKVESGSSYGETRSDEVTTEGIITISAGETAVINGLLAGTKFEVKETSTSSAGYIVGYSVGDAAVTDGSFPSGAVGASSGSDASSGSSEVSIVVTNTQLYELPETGGSGVAPYALAGLALVGAALFGAWRMRHRGKAA